MQRDGSHADEDPAEMPSDVTSDVTGESLELRRIVAARPDRVFDAWTNPEMIPKWFKPGGVPLRHVDLDLRVGGRWHMTMGEPGGRQLAGSGVFREIDRPRRVVYTWNWDPDPVGRETVVSVEFHEHRAGTEIIIRHDGFPAARARDQHNGGWTACLDALALLYLETPEVV